MPGKTIGSGVTLMSLKTIFEDELPQSDHSNFMRRGLGTILCKTKTDFVFNIFYFYNFKTKKKKKIKFLCLQINAERKKIF